MSTVRLYDPNNEPFDVPQPRVSDLVLNHGWTQSPFEVVEGIEAREEAEEVLADEPVFEEDEDDELVDAPEEEDDEHED